MYVTQDIQDRIIQAAEQLHSKNPHQFPTVAAVRALAQANMNDVSVVMRQWRKAKDIQEEEAVSAEIPPTRVLEEAEKVITQFWLIAEKQAEESLREAEAQFAVEKAKAEKLQQDLSAIRDSLQNQLEQTITESQSTLTLEVQAKEAAETALQQTKNRLKQANEEIAKLYAEKKQAEQEKALALAKNEELEKHTNSLTLNLTTQREELERVQNLLAKKDSEITRLNEQLTEVKNSSDHAEKQRYSMDVEHQKIISQLEKQVIELKGQIKIEQAMVGQSQQYVTELKDLLTQQQMQTQSLQKQLDNAVGSIVSLSAENKKASHASKPSSKHTKVDN